MSINQESKLLFAIAGASCSGKTRIRKSLLALLDQSYITHLDLDGYHIHDREGRIRLSKFPDQLEENDFIRLCSDLAQYRQGQSITVPVYNHWTGDFGKPKELKQKPIIIIEGLHALRVNDICGKDIIDFGIFLDPEDDLRHSWKVKRDVVERSYSYYDAIEQIERREPFVKKNILTQRKLADVIVLITFTSSAKVLYNVILKQDIIDKNELLQEIFKLSKIMGQEPYLPGLYYYLISEIHMQHLKEVIRVLNHVTTLPGIKRLSFVSNYGSYYYMLQCLIAVVIVSVLNINKG